MLKIPYSVAQTSHQFFFEDRESTRQKVASPGGSSLDWGARKESFPQGPTGGRDAPT